MVLQLGQHAHGHVGSLERLDPAHEQQQWPVLGQSQRPSCLGAIPGTEERVVDPGGHDADPLRVACVELGELRRLHGARRQHDVGAAHDGRLGFGPAMRFVARHLLGARLGLHPGEGVERGHEREIELVLDAVAGDARQPVVGVDGVEASLLVRRRGPAGARHHERQHVVGELVDDVGQRLLGHGGERSGGDVVDPQARLDGLGGRERLRPRPGVDVALHPGAGQRRGQFPHVDVHSPAVPGAGLGQGGGVQGEHRQSSHRRGAYLEVLAVHPVAEPLGPPRGGRRMLSRSRSASASGSACSWCTASSWCPASFSWRNER